MKKLLYTLLLGLVVVSCSEKYEESFEAPLAEQELDTQLTNDEMFDLVNSILDGTYPAAKEGFANASNKGEDYVRVLVFTDSDNSYLVLTDETNDDLCADDVNPFEMFFDNSAGDGSVLTVESPEGTNRLELSGNFAGFFSSALNSIQKTDASGERSSVVFNDSNSATFTE